MAPVMVLRPLAEGDEDELRRIHATPEVWHDSLLMELLAGEE
jgi:hypothetical protein